MRRLGSVQIRNAATIGGNLANASPCADTAPPLIALGASARIAGRSGARACALEDFFKAPGESAAAPDELLTALALPPPRAGWRSRFLRQQRVYMDLAQASVAVAIELDGDACVDLRIVAGAVAPTPLRLRDAEAVLRGQRITPALLERARAVAAAEVRPISDVRASEAYRRHLVGVFVRRAVRDLVSGETP